MGTKEICKFEICANPPRKNFPTGKTDVYYKEHVRIMDRLDRNDCVPKKFRGFSDIIVVIKKFSHLGWTAPLKIKNAQTGEGSFENILKHQKDNRVWLTLMLERIS